MNKKVVGGISLVAVMIMVGYFLLGSDYSATEPKVTSGEAKTLETSIYLQGMITSNGDKEITEYGFNWGTSSSLDKTQIVGVSIAENNTYETNISNLKAGNTYYYQAYAVNDKGIGYGEIKEITLPIPPNDPPTISLISPTTDISVTKGEVVNISAQAKDDKVVVGMTLFVNQEVKSETLGDKINFKWDTSNISKGEYPIKVLASDGAKTSEKIINIVVKEAIKQVASNSDIAQKPNISNPATNNPSPSRGSSPVAASNKYPKLSKVNGAFGQFPYRDIAGGRIEIDPQWIEKNIVTITLPGLNRKVQVHKDAADNFIMAFNYIKNGTTVINGKEVPLLSLIKTMDGTFVPRHVNWNASRGLSNHSWGTAIDINAANHFRYVDPAQEPNNPNLILWEKAFKPAGFSWGNSYSDAMHYELYK